LIFLDTGFLFALFDQDDANHVRVREVVERERGKRLSDLVVTTNHVVGETLTLARTRGVQDALWRHARAVEIGRQLHAGVFGQIHHVTEDEERAAFEYFAKYADKMYSFVDCTSFVVMEKLGIGIAWSVDDDFNHRFRAVPGPLPR
jgi:predicted nucleic acid-binding protein